jgi:hypothetical protein
MAARNALANMKWDFDVPNINNLLQPVQRGYDQGLQDQQRNVENQRADEQLNMQRDRLGMEKTRMDRQGESERLTRLGKAAAAVHQMPEGPEKAARAKALLDGHSDLAPQFSRYGINGANPVAAVGLLAQSWGEYDPLAVEAKRAQIDASKASAAAARANAGNIGLTDPIREFQFAKRNGFTGSFDDWKKQGQNNNASQNITWGRDAAGNWVPMQATRSGELVASRMPANVQPVPVPELAEAKAAATERGQGLGKAQVDLPAVEANADLIYKTLDQVKQAVDDAPRMVGALTSRLPNVTADANKAQSMIDQTSGKVFLQAYAALRGGGAITEAEGAKAEASLSRLRTTAVGTRAYNEAIDDVRKEIAALVEVARKKAQAGGRPAAAAAAGGATQSRPRAVNPSTGQAVEFDGSQWVPVR